MPASEVHFPGEASLENTLDWGFAFLDVCQAFFSLHPNSTVLHRMRILQRRRLFVGMFRVTHLWFGSKFGHQMPFLGFLAPEFSSQNFFLWPINNGISSIGSPQGNHAHVSPVREAFRVPGTWELGTVS